MIKNRKVSWILGLLIAVTPLCAHASAPVISTQGQIARGASDALLTTFPLASSLVGYGWAQSGFAYAAKIIGVDMSVLIGLAAVQEAVHPHTNASLDTPSQVQQPVAVPKTASYYVGCAAGIGTLGLLLAYKAARCDESAFSILVKTGLGTLVTRITGALVRPIIEKSGMTPEAQIAAQVLKQVTVDTRITGALAQKLLAS